MSDDKTNLTGALGAAFHLHTVKQPDLPLRDPNYSTELRRLNLSRTSLLHDSWPFKALAFVAFSGRADDIPAAPTPLSSERLQQHEVIITEEWSEMWTALMNDDLLEVLDGGLDLIYTVLNLLIEIGFPPQVIQCAYEEIHASNLTKCDEHGNPVFHNGKVQKTEHYAPADLRAAARRFPPFDYDLLPESKD